MRYSLKDLARRQRNIRRQSITLHDIVPPAMLATDLYRSCYLPLITAWSNALPRINDAYARSLSEIVTDSPADVQAEVDSAASALQRLVMTLTPQVRNWALRVEVWHRNRWRGAVLSATGVDLSTMIGPEGVAAALETHIEWNTALIRDVSDQIRQRVGNDVFDGLRNRTPAREVGKAINDAVGLGRDRSQRIASDQLQKMTSALADERRREAGITAWEWVHSRKLHPRARHVERNGNYYTDDPSAVGESINGKTLHAPPDDRPGQLPWCGCRARSVIDMSE